MKKPAWNESQLRRLIRKIVQEELSQMEGNHQTPTQKFSYDGFEGFDDFDGFAPSLNERPAPSKKKQPDFEPNNEPWAIFGAPEPAPSKTRRVKEERPRALPGWSEPYRPSYSELESPPNSSRKKKR